MKCATLWNTGNLWVSGVHRSHTSACTIKAEFHKSKEEAVQRIHQPLSFSTEAKRLLGNLMYSPRQQSPSRHDRTSFYQFTCSLLIWTERVFIFAAVWNWLTVAMQQQWSLFEVRLWLKWKCLGVPEQKTQAGLSAVVILSWEPSWWQSGDGNQSWLALHPSSTIIIHCQHHHHQPSLYSPSAENIWWFNFPSL